MSKKNIAVIGASYGDEGKAKIVNYFAKDYKYVLRFSSSSNAGHTFYYNGNKIIRHLIPSADFSIKEQIAFLGSGMVINPDELLKEIHENMEIFPNIGKQIIVDPEAFIITQAHLDEDKENMIKFGSTGKGVSPAYRDKVNRKGTRLQSLIKDNALVISALKDLGVTFKTSYELYEDFEKSNILFEGAQSVSLDLNFGSYPYVTSGETTINGMVNSGFANFLPNKIFGIIKCYTTKVGKGCFPAQIFGKEADAIREKGQEIGATTKRPRDIGWLDLPNLKYNIRKGGITNLVITKVDILDGMNIVPVCTSYDKDITCADDFNNVKPNFTNVKGWKNSKDINELSEFISVVEKHSGKQVSLISCGKDKDDILKIES